MNDRELPNAAARWGASLMTRVYAVSEAGSKSSEACRNRRNGA